MPTLITKTSIKWCQIIGISPDDIINPTGWSESSNGYHYSFYNELISLNKFKQRLTKSELNETALSILSKVEA